MKRNWQSRTVVCWLSFGLACVAGGALLAAQEDPDEGMMGLIVEWVKDADRETRAVALQQIREGLPGEAVTRKFAGLLSDLSADAQADLLEALGDRGDAAARPAVLEMIKGPQEAVRAAALRALGALGDQTNVALLAGRAAAGSGAERDAARQSLVRLRGEDVNGAILSAMAEAGPPIRVELLAVLASRNAKQGLPVVLKSTEDPERSVRLAALGALRYLADQSHTAEVVKTLKAAGDTAQRRKAELALLGVCNRGREACVGPIAAGLAEADVAARIALLHALARCGGAQALQEMAARLKDEDQSVRDEAVRMLAGWSDPAVAEQLRPIAQSDDNLRHQVLAIRGLVRLAGPQPDKPADVKTLAELMDLAKRPQEKRLVLGAIGGTDTEVSLALAVSALGDSALAEEAALAAVAIAERIKDGDKQKIRAAMAEVLKAAKNEQTRDRASKLSEASNP